MSIALKRLTMGVAGVFTAALLTSSAQAAENDVSTLESESNCAYIDQGHVDVIGIEWDHGELEIHVHDETTDTEYEADEVLLGVRPEAKTTVPNDSQYSFLGEPGAKVWILPQHYNPDVLFAGWATEEVPSGVFVNDELTIEILGASGKGKVALYRENSFGQVELYFDSSAGPGQIDVFADAHGHLNWAFTKSGYHTLTVQVSGVLVDGGQTVVSEETEFHFWVWR